MEELYELRRYIEMGDTAAALALLDEMDEMSRDDKVQKIASFMRVLLVHMIKQAAEYRTTKSWEVSATSIFDNRPFRRHDGRGFGGTRPGCMLSGPDCALIAVLVPRGTKA